MRTPLTGNPIDVLHEFAEIEAKETGRQIDEEAFAAARAYLNEPMIVLHGISAPVAIPQKVWDRIHKAGVVLLDASGRWNPRLIDEEQKIRLGPARNVDSDEKIIADFLKQGDA